MGTSEVRGERWGIGIQVPSDIVGPARLSVILAWRSYASASLGLPWAASHIPPDLAIVLNSTCTQAGPTSEPLQSWVTSGIAVSVGQVISQKYWSGLTSLGRKHRLTNSVGDKDAIRLSQQQGPITSGWLTVRPSPLLNTVFSSSTFRTILQWHLGTLLLPTEWAGVPCPLGCKMLLHPYGDHAVSCMHGGLVWHRHRGIQTFIARCLRNAGIPHKLEVSVSHDALRDADIHLPNWDQGAGLAIDVSVVHACPIA